MFNLASTRTSMWVSSVELHPRSLGPSLCCRMGIFHPSCKTLHFAFFERREVPASPFLQAVQVPLSSYPSILTAFPSLVSCPDLLRAHAVPPSRSLMKALNSDDSSTDPWSTPLVVHCQVDFALMIVTFQARQSTLLFTYPASTQQFGDKSIGNCFKGPNKIKA